MTWVHRSGATRIVLALYVLAAVTLGFAHRRLNFEPTAAPVNVAAYAVTDCPPPTICLTKTSADKTAPAHAHKICDACSLAHTSALPPNQDWTSSALKLGRDKPLQRLADACGESNEPDNVRSRAPPMQPVMKV